MFKHGVTELVCSLIACLNIVTGVILYSQEVKDGITLKTAARRKAIMACTTMCLVFGGIAVLFMMYDIATHAW
uniref:Uncharacterized protein n=1 Tax=Candidozyma auris TaxID=498019 RepID=A0A0L0NUJ2_CANAR